jgi:hypothetical protein
VGTHRNAAVARNYVVYNPIGKWHDTKHRDALNSFAKYCLECCQNIDRLNDIVRITYWQSRIHSLVMAATSKFGVQSLRQDFFLHA